MGCSQEGSPALYADEVSGGERLLSYAVRSGGAADGLRRNARRQPKPPTIGRWGALVTYPRGFGCWADRRLVGSDHPHGGTHASIAKSFG